MKNAKKIAVLCLALMMLVALAACNGDGASQPGKRSVSACAFEGLMEAKEIQELTCSFTAYSSDDWEELFTSEAVTVTF